MGKTQRVGLSIFDRGVLLVAWSITSALVYLLGFYVGKGTQEGPVGTDQRLISMPVTSKPPPEGQQPKTNSPFDFYGHLGEPGHGGEPAAPMARLPDTPPPSAPTLTVPAPTAKPAQALAAVVPSAGRTGSGPVPAASPPPEAQPASARPPAKTTAEAAPPAAGVEHAAPQRAPDPEATPHTAVAAVAPAPAPIPSNRTGAWTVEVNPTRNRDEVEALQAQLRRRGYETTVIRVPREGDTWYRLRVGRYTTSDQATQVMHRLRTQEGVTHAFVASE